MALPGALCQTLLAATGFTNKRLRALIAGLLGSDYRSGQMTYDLRRLRLAGLIRRVDHPGSGRTPSLAVLGAYQQLFGLELEHLAVDGCITKAPAADRSPGEPGRPPQAGLETLDGHRRGWHPAGRGPGGGQPPRRRAAWGDPGHPGRVSTAIGRLPVEPVVHLDAGYDDQACRQVLAALGMAGEVAPRGMPAPVQATRRWPVERTHAWGNQYGKLRWWTERRRIVVQFWLALAAAVIVCGRLVRRAWTSYRWHGRPRRRP